MLVPARLHRVHPWALAARGPTCPHDSRRPTREDQPAHHREGGERSGHPMTKQHRGRRSTRERGEVRHDVVHRRDEPFVEHVSAGDDHTAGEGHCEKDTDHPRSVTGTLAFTALGLLGGGL